VAAEEIIGTPRQLRPWRTTVAGVAGYALAAVQRVLLLVILAGLWIYVGQPSYPQAFPPLEKVLRSFFTTWTSPDALVDYLVPTVNYVISGFAITALVGIAVAVAVARHDRLVLMIDPWIRLAMATPIVMLLPFAIAVFGLGTGMTLFLIVFATVWPVMVTTIDAVRAVDATTLASARSLRLSPLVIATRVMVPAAAPRVLTGLRTAVALALVLVVVTGMYTGAPGLGSYIIQAQESFRTADLWAGVMAVGLLGLMINLVFLLIERRLLVWQRPRS
jgi:ABC-type nitrate/sulfonate/bicarbonate transport system permease component